MKLVIGSLCAWSCLTAAASAQETPEGAHYGVDVSWPMHHSKVSTNYPWLPHNANPDNYPTPDRFKTMQVQPLGDIQGRYEKYMQACYDYYEEKKGPGKGQACWDTEYDRIEMTLRQPQGMRNYTETGFLKMRAPDKVFQLLKEFWDKNKEARKPERWTVGNIYTNHWESPTYMVSVEDSDHEGGGYVLKQHVWNAARDTIEHWTGHRQAECSLYGIRIYTEGSMLAPHVDRNPLVSSAIINVDQDVDEPWPLEVIGHDGIARNVTMVPGDLVLYESHSVIHGRQFPLKGRFMANIFIHFEPIGPINGELEYDGDLPPYVLRGSKEEIKWRRSHPDGHQIMGDRHQEFETGTTMAHTYAALDQYDELKEFLDENEEAVTHRDKNGWTPLAEAVRTGSEKVVRLLLDRGAELNARVGLKEEGGSILWIAKEELGEDHEVVQLLKDRGAYLVEPSARQDL